MAGLNVCCERCAVSYHDAFDLREVRPGVWRCDCCGESDEALLQARWAALLELARPATEPPPRRTMVLAILDIEGRPMHLAHYAGAGGWRANAPVLAWLPLPPVVVLPEAAKAWTGVVYANAEDREAAERAEALVDARRELRELVAPGLGTCGDLAATKLEDAAFSAGYRAAGGGS